MACPQLTAALLHHDGLVVVTGRGPLPHEALRLVSVAHHCVCARGTTFAGGPLAGDALGRAGGRAAAFAWGLAAERTAAGELVPRLVQRVVPPEELLGVVGQTVARLLALPPETARSLARPWLFRKAARGVYPDW